MLDGFSRRDERGGGGDTVWIQERVVGKYVWGMGRACCGLWTVGDELVVELRWVGGGAVGAVGGGWCGAGRWWLGGGGGVRQPRYAR